MILQAAIRSGGVVYTKPRPARHHTILHAMPEHAKKGHVQGFIDEFGDFFTRERAAFENTWYNQRHQE